MKQIAIIKNSDLGFEEFPLSNPQIRTAARGIVIRNDGKIAIFNKVKKNEYKLPGGGIEETEDIKECFIREVFEETGCKIKIIKEIGIIEEHRSRDNFKQISHIFEAKVISKTNKAELTSKEKNEGGKTIWTTPEKGLELIEKCIHSLKQSKYEDLYHSKFIVYRDKIILEYYLNKHNENTKWNILYKNYINKEYEDWDKYFKVKMKLKKPFLNLVIKYSKSNKPILECGCGTAKTSIYFANLGMKVYAMDLEPGMVKEANKLSKTICPQNRVKVIEGNIKNIPYTDKYFSVTHSSGVLEHYLDGEIIELINEQIRVSDYCVFSVPTRYFEKKMLGNERFMSRKQWRNIIDKSNARIIKESGYHYKSLNKRIIDIIKKPIRLFKPIALYVFVLEERRNKNDLHS